MGAVQASGYAPGSEGLLSPLAPFLNRTDLSELLINQPGEVWIEAHGALSCHEVPEMTLSHLNQLCQLIANENKQCLSRVHPLLSGSLTDGSRVQIVMPPVAKTPVLSIRRKVVRHLSLQHYVDQKFFETTKAASSCSDEKALLADNDQALLALYQQRHFAKFIQKAIASKKNIIISGGTSSGKTTFLNACLQAIEPEARLLILEDTREVEAPQKNQVALLATKGEQGEAKVSMQDLVQCGLRLRPDRIFLGEIRGKEILDFISAASTGHEGSMTSIHANNPEIAFMRMTQMYKLNNVPSMKDEDILNELKTIVDVIVQLEKAPHGQRRVQSIYYKYGHLANEKKMR